MCVAIPMGKRDGDSETRSGRFLRARPLRIALLAGLGVVAVGALAPLASAVPGTERLLLANGVALPLFGVLLERLPARCRGTEIGYLRYGAIGATALLAAPVMLLGRPGAAAGALLFALAWQLAARPLRWQIDWCRVPLPSGLRLLPQLLTAGTLMLLAFAVAAFVGATVPVALLALLLELLAGILVLLILRNVS